MNLALLAFVVKNLSRSAPWIVLCTIMFLLLLQQNGIAFWQKRQIAFDTAAYTQQNRILKTELQRTTRVLSQTINEKREQETTIKVIEGDKAQLQQNLGQLSRFMAGKFRELAYEVEKIKDIKSITNLRVETSGQFVTITRDSIVEKTVDRMTEAGEVEEDTIREAFKLINYTEPNGWFTMTGVQKGDTFTFNPTFINEFDLDSYKKHRERKYWIDPKWLRRKILVARVTNKNPYARTTHFEHMVQNRRRNRKWNKQ